MWRGDEFHVTVTGLEQRLQVQRGAVSAMRATRSDPVRLIEVAANGGHA